MTWLPARDDAATSGGAGLCTSPRIAKDVAGLAVLLATSGGLHLVRPRPFENIVPRRLPAKRGLVYLSGVAELICAGGLVARPTRRVAGVSSAALLVAVFPANVQMTMDVFRRRGLPAKILASARLPLQIPLVVAAWHAWRGEQGHDPAETSVSPARLVGGPVRACRAPRRGR